MVGRVCLRLFTRTGRCLSYAVTKAFSSKYLLLTNLTISAGMSGSADGLVQKTCRHQGVGKYKTGDNIQWYVCVQILLVSCLGVKAFIQ